MARKQRNHEAGVTQHVLQRGNNREAIFFADDDYIFYRDCLKEASELHDCEVHAYVQMTNHIHLLVTPRIEGGLAKMMKLLNQKYAQYINWTYRRTGGLWEGRYKTCLLNTDRYVLTLYRYIELNPVRARMVDRPSKYQWSSALGNGVRPIGSDPILKPHPLYLALGRTEHERQHHYRELFRDQMAVDLVHKIDDALMKEVML